MVKALCKGGRTPKKQSFLQAFTPLWLTLDERRDWFYVRQLEAVAPQCNLVGNNLFAGLYLNELLYLALRPQDPHLHLYEAYQLTIHTLANVTDREELERCLRRFEWVLLSTCGYQITLTHDARTGLNIDPNKQYRFVAEEGFFEEKVGICGAHILALAENKLDNRDVLKVAKRIMRSAINHALGGQPLKSRELLRASIPVRDVK